MAIALNNLACLGQRYTEHLIVNFRNVRVSLGRNPSGSCISPRERKQHGALTPE